MAEGFVCGDGTRLSVEVRVSTRAKHHRLQLSYQGVLELVLPESAARRLGITPAGATDSTAGGASDCAKARHSVLDTESNGNLIHDDGCRTQIMLTQKPRQGFSYSLTAAAPAGLPEAAVDALRDFLEQNRRWIERAAVRTKEQRESYEESRAAGLPTHLDFPLADELWLVEYHPTQARSITARPSGLRRFQGSRCVFVLKLSGAVHSEELCRRALIRFVTRRAKEVIPAFAREVCREVGATPRDITVNNRRSAWGVCTRAGDIRIDRRVLFFPADLARQVVLHEAAHLKHLNHSARFYDELFSYEGSTREAERAVKAGARFVPAWFIDG
jgi:predicted metal-dependent hydrolase